MWHCIADKLRVKKDNWATKKIIKNKNKKIKNKNSEERKAIKFLKKFVSAKRINYKMH